MEFKLWFSSEVWSWETNHILRTSDAIVSLLPEKGVLDSIQFSRSVVFDSLQPHELQHSRLPCPSPIPEACSNSCPLSWWCHPTISSSIIPFSSCLQSFPASGSFPMSHFFASCGQSIGASDSASVLPMIIQDWFPLGWMDWLDLLAVQGTFKSLLQHHSSKHSSALSFLYGPALTSIHNYWKNHSFIYGVLDLLCMERAVVFTTLTLWVTSLSSCNLTFNPIQHTAIHISFSSSSFRIHRWEPWSLTRSHW